MSNRLRVRRGDNVIVITGKYRGTKGRILKVFPKDDRVIVENVNFIKKHSKGGRKGNQPSQIIEKEAPIHVSNVMLWSDKLKTVTKPVVKIVGNSRVRVCKKTGDELN